MGRVVVTGGAGWMGRGIAARFRSDGSRVVLADRSESALADAAGAIVYIGVVGGHSLFGLKGALTDVVQAPPAGATQFRYEVTMAYHTRYLELLAAYRDDHDRLPVGNINIDARHLGRLRLG